MQFIFATMPNQVANNQVEILRLLCPPVLLIMDKFGVASTRNCVQIGIFCRHRMAKTRQNTHTLTRFVMFLRGFCVHTHLLITAKFGLQNRRMISAYVPNNFCLDKFVLLPLAGKNATKILQVQIWHTSEISAANMGSVMPRAEVTRLNTDMFVFVDGKPFSPLLLGWQ